MQLIANEEANCAYDAHKNSDYSRANDICANKRTNTNASSHARPYIVPYKRTNDDISD